MAGGEGWIDGKKEGRKEEKEEGRMEERKKERMMNEGRVEGRCLVFLPGCVELLPAHGTDFYPRVRRMAEAPQVRGRGVGVRVPGRRCGSDGFCGGGDGRPSFRRKTRGMK